MKIKLDGEDYKKISQQLKSIEIKIDSLGNRDSIKRFIYERGVSVNRQLLLAIFLDCLENDTQKLNDKIFVKVNEMLQKYNNHCRSSRCSSCCLRRMYQRINIDYFRCAEMFFLKNMLEDSLKE
jgi:hypothetical protein